jgi:hypothetical protein
MMTMMMNWNINVSTSNSKIESEAAGTKKSLIRRDARGDRFTQFFVRVKHSPFESHPHFRRQV